MSGLDHVLVFSLGELRFGLHLAVVERVLRSVEISPVPTSSDTVMGLLNLQGRIIPVLNIRKLMRLTERDPELNDRLIITRAFGRNVALPADDVSGVVECPSGAVVSAAAIQPGMGCVEGVAVFDDGLVLIYELERFLSVKDGASALESLAPAEGDASVTMGREESS